MRPTSPGCKPAFTLIELLVVMAIVATLLALAAPRYAGSIGKAKEAVLRANLASLREVLDKYHADRGSYPETLEQLVAAQYLKRIPMDPMTESDQSWITVPAAGAGQGGIADVRSGASGIDRQGRPYREW